MNKIDELFYKWSIPTGGLESSTKMTKKGFHKAIQEELKEAKEEYAELMALSQQIQEQNDFLTEEYRELQLKTDVCCCDEQSQWHDLRDNPEDLPEKEVLAYNGSDYLIGYVGEDVNIGLVCESDGELLTDVIAWRELPKWEKES